MEWHATNGISSIPAIDENKNNASLLLLTIELVA